MLTHVQPIIHLFYSSAIDSFQGIFFLRLNQQSYKLEKSLSGTSMKSVQTCPGVSMKRTNKLLRSKVTCLTLVPIFLALSYTTLYSHLTFLAILLRKLIFHRKIPNDRDKLIIKMIIDYYNRLRTNVYVNGKKIEKKRERKKEKEKRIE